MNKKLLGFGILLLGATVAVLVFMRGCTKENTPEEIVAPVTEPEQSPKTVELVPVVSTPVVVAPIAVKKTPSVTPVKKTPVVSTPVTPPPVILHKELIPKSVDIVRVYYANTLTAPGSTVEFDINGSGFTTEFEKMIRVESGHDDVQIKDFELLTPNQIHGKLVISPKASTKICYPRVLIQEKVVFQAADPYAVIREGEVLNVIFTEMGESGRTGRFRVFTNLTPELFEKFRVQASTPAIQVANLRPTFPFLVDGDIVIGPAAGGDYGLSVTLNEKVLWNRDGIIRVVRPNVGQSGLVQRLQALEEFCRPGDRLVFALQGSGFRPEDVNLLSARVSGLEVSRSTFVFLAPGRMELSVWVPESTPVGTYSVSILQGDAVLLDSPKAFVVVDRNWLRGFKLDPDIKAGGQGYVRLLGRDLDKEFVAKLKVEVDEPQLTIGNFSWENPNEAKAPISAGSSVKPGDYLIHLSFDGKSLNSQFGNIIRISK